MDRNFVKNWLELNKHHYETSFNLAIDCVAANNLWVDGKSFCEGTKDLPVWVLSLADEVFDS